MNARKVAEASSLRAASAQRLEAAATLCHQIARRSHIKSPPEGR